MKANNTPEVIESLELSKLHPFPDHPFAVRDDVTMQQTVESIKQYLAANTGEFCSLIRYLFDLATPIHIITEDEAYNINTIINEDQQKEELYRMAYSFTEMNPDEYRKWIEGVFLGIDKHVLQEGGHYGI